MNLAEIVMHIVKAEGEEMILNLLAASISEPSETTYRHTPGAPSVGFTPGSF